MSELRFGRKLNCTFVFIGQEIDGIDADRFFSDAIAGAFIEEKGVNSERINIGVAYPAGVAT